MESDQSWGKVYYYWYGHSPRRASSDRIAPQSLQTGIQTQMNNLKTKFVNKGYPVIVGEYGCNRRSLSSTQGTQANHDESVQYWYNFSTEYSYEAGLIPFAWDTNYIGFPHMTIINRSTPAVYDTYILNGIKEGDTAGRSAYNKIYPEPATTGINDVKIANKAKDGMIYNIQGEAVGKDVTSLPKGLYIRSGEKFVK